MKTSISSIRPKFAIPGLVAALFATSVLVSHAQTQSQSNRHPNRAQLVEALRLDNGPSTNAAPVRRTRGLAITPQGQAESADTNNAPEPAVATVATQTQPRAERVQPQQTRAIDLDIQFEFDSDQLTNDGRDLLDQLGEALRDQALASIRTVTIEGHTDSIGNVGYNKLLSVRRANAAKTYLIRQHQIAGNKLRPVGKGSSEPVDGVPSTDPSNRRVRIVVQG